MQFQVHKRIILIVGFLLIAVSSHAQQVIKLTAATGHPNVLLWVKALDEVFISEIDKRLAVDGRYRIEWTKPWGGTLLKLGSE